MLVHCLALSSWRAAKWMSQMLALEDFVKINVFGLSWTCEWLPSTWIVLHKCLDNIIHGTFWHEDESHNSYHNRSSGWLIRGNASIPRLVLTLQSSCRHILCGNSASRLCQDSPVVVVLCKGITRQWGNVGDVSVTALELFRDLREEGFLSSGRWICPAVSRSNLWERKESTISWFDSPAGK